MSSTPKKNSPQVFDLVSKCYNKEGHWTSPFILIHGRVASGKTRTIPEIINQIKHIFTNIYIIDPYMDHVHVNKYNPTDLYIRDIISQYDTPGSILNHVVASNISDEFIKELIETGKQSTITNPHLQLLIIDHTIINKPLSLLLEDAKKHNITIIVTKTHYNESLKKCCDIYVGKYIDFRSYIRYQNKEYHDYTFKKDSNSCKFSDLSSISEKK